MTVVWLYNLFIHWKLPFDWEMFLVTRVSTFICCLNWTFFDCSCWYRVFYNKVCYCIMTSVSFFIFCCKVWYISVWNCEVLHCALHCASKQSTVHRARMALLQKHKKNLWCYLPLGERAFDTVCSICHSASLLDFK